MAISGIVGFTDFDLDFRIRILTNSSSNSVAIGFTNSISFRLVKSGNSLSFSFNQLYSLFTSYSYGLVVITPNRFGDIFGYVGDDIIFDFMGKNFILHGGRLSEDGVHVDTFHYPYCSYGDDIYYFTDGNSVLWDFYGLPIIYLNSSTMQNFFNNSFGCRFGYNVVSSSLINYSSSLLSIVSSLDSISNRFLNSSNENYLALQNSNVEHIAKRISSSDSNDLFTKIGLLYNILSQIYSKISDIKDTLASKFDSINLNFSRIYSSIYDFVTYFFSSDITGYETFGEYLEYLIKSPLVTLASRLDTLNTRENTENSKLDDIKTAINNISVSSPGVGGSGDLIIPEVNVDIICDNLKEASKSFVPKLSMSDFDV